MSSQLDCWRLAPCHKRRWFIFVIIFNWKSIFCFWVDCTYRMTRQCISDMHTRSGDICGLGCIFKKHSVFTIITHIFFLQNICNFITGKFPGYLRSCWSTWSTDLTLWVIALNYLPHPKKCLHWYICNQISRRYLVNRIDVFYKIAFSNIPPNVCVGVIKV